MPSAAKKPAVKKKVSPSLLFSKKTPYQTIELVKHHGGMLLKLNGSWQVHTNEEKLYHESFATVPLMLAEKVDKVVILGGGDGLALRNVLHFPQVKEVTLVELDQGVIDLCSTNEFWCKLNEGSLTNPRAKVICADAIDWFMKTKETFDVIIHDLEDTETDQPQAISIDLYRALFDAIRDKLNPGGVMVTTVASDDQIDGMLKALFDSQGDAIPPAVRTAFSRKRSVIGRSEVLLKTLFSHVLNWPVEFPELDTHAMFYCSQKALKKVRRQPDAKPEFVQRFFESERFRKSVYAASTGN